MRSTDQNSQTSEEFTSEHSSNLQERRGVPNHQEAAESRNAIAVPHHDVVGLAGPDPFHQDAPSSTAAPAYLTRTARPGIDQSLRTRTA
jgi:hypothetical protein